MHEERVKSLGRSVRALPLSHSPTLPLSHSLTASALSFFRHLWRLDELHRREVGGHVEAQLPRPIGGGRALSRARREQSACRLGKTIHLCRVGDRQRECLGRVEHLNKGDKNRVTKLADLGECVVTYGQTQIGGMRLI